MKTSLLLLVILLGAACSKGPATSAKFAITIGGLSAGGNAITQIVITGQSDSGKRFSRVLTNGTDSVTLDLPNEAWNFLAMAWEGTDLDGKVRCAVSREKLDGQEVTVSLALTNATCFDGTLNVNSPESFNGNPSFKDTQWKACRTDLASIVSPGESCLHDSSVTASRGAVIGTMEVAIVGGFKIGEKFIPNGEKMASVCATIPTFATINQRYPVVNSNYFFPLVAIAYADTACGAANGFAASFLSDEKIKPIEDSPTVSMFAHFSDADVCGMTNFTTINAVGMGNGVSPHALCNLTQLKHWQENFSTHAAKHVALLSDLDLLPWIKAGLSGPSPYKLCLEEGSTFLPLGMTTNAACSDLGTVPYTGTFHGMGRMISHMRIQLEDSDNVGFFRAFGTGGNVVSVRFEKPSVRGADYVGVVVGNGTNGGTDTARIRVNLGEVEGENYVGMLAGAFTSSATALTELSATGKVRGENFVGGLAGTATYLEKLSFRGNVTSDSGSNIGGIAGVVASVSEAIQGGLVKGADRVGGIAASAGSIIDVRVNGAILGTLDSGSANRHGGIVADATGTDILRAVFLGSLYSYNTSGGGVGAIAGNAPTTHLNTYSIQTIARGGGLNAISGGASSKASAMWSELCTGGTPWICGDTDADLILDAGEGADLPRLAFEAHVCSLPANLATVAVQSATRGTAQSPIIICDKEQLAEIPTYSTRHYRLEQDISLAFGGFTKITPTSFGGVFDGNKHALHGYINDSLTTSYGLFSQIIAGATVKNLDLANFHLNSTDDNLSILGTNYGTLENIRAVASSLSTDLKTVGGIASLNAGTMTKIYADMSVTGLGVVGGIVGSNAGTMSDIVSEVRVSGNGSGSSAGADVGFGGVVGLNSGLISKATFAGSLFIGGTPWDPSQIGGLAGYNDGGITDSEVTDDAQLDIQNVTASRAGSLVGYVDSSTGTLARLISHSPLKSTNASAYVANKYGATFGEFGPGGGEPASIISYEPLLQNSGYTQTVVPDFTWNGTSMCVSNTITTSIALTNGSLYYNLPAYGEDGNGISMTYQTSPNRFEFPGTSAAICNEYDNHLEIFTAHLPSNGMTLAQLKTLGFSIGDLENGSAAEKNLYFSAYLNHLKGATSSTPLWVYEEGTFSIFRVNDK